MAHSFPAIACTEDCVYAVSHFTIRMEILFIRTCTTILLVQVLSHPLHHYSYGILMNFSRMDFFEFVLIAVVTLKADMIALILYY